MQLNKNQILKIKQKVNLNSERTIVRIDVSEDKTLSPQESSSNVYCINNQYEIIWQVKEIKTQRHFDEDMFVYLGKNSKGEIIADRFSGFVYKIDPDTGEAEQIGFHK